MTDKTKTARASTPATKYKVIPSIAINGPTTKRDLVKLRILEQKREFLAQDIIQGNSALKLTTSNILGELHNLDELSRKGRTWIKTNEFGKSDYWLGILKAKPPKPHRDEPEIHKEKRIAAAKSPRKTKVPEVAVKIIKAIGENSKPFTIENLSKELGVHLRSVREVVKIMSYAGELSNDGARANSEWHRTDIFGTTEIWKIETGETKYRWIREKFAKKPK